MRRSIRFSVIAATWVVWLTIVPQSLGMEAAKPPSRTAAPQDQKVAFHVLSDKDFESSFTWQQLQDGTATISIANDSDLAQTITVKGDHLTPLNGAPAAEKSNPVLTIEPAHAQKIAPHQITTFHLGIDQKVPRFSGPGDFGATVTFDSGDPKTVRYQKIQIKVQSARPVLSKLSVLVTQWVFGFCSPLATAKVPLAGNLPQQSLPRIVGYVQADDRSLPVRWTAVEQPSDSADPPQAILKVENLRGAGRYDGQINLGGLAEKEGQTTFTIIVKDGFIWPTSVIVVGTLLAFVAKRYIGVSRAIWNALKLEAELGTAFAAGQQQFQVIAKTEPYSAFSIDADLTARRTGIVNRLNKLWKTASVSIANDPVYIQAMSDMKELAADIQLWPSLATAARGLRDALTATSAILNPMDTVPPSKYPHDPEKFVSLYRGLAGHPINCNDVAGLVKQFQDGTAFLELWKAAYESAASISQQFYVAFHERPTPSDEDATKLDAIQTSLTAVWTKLFFAGEVSVKDDLLVAIETLNSLKPVVKSMSLRPDNRLELDVEPLTNAEQAFEVLHSKTVLQIDDQQKARHLGRLIAIGDVLSTILALFIALLTGLNANYLGYKPWGTPQDYVVLFLWAAGTKVGLDIVTAVTDKFLSSTTALS